jgi:ABC-type sugar transport system ATPase subunit
MSTSVASEESLAKNVTVLDGLVKRFPGTIAVNNVSVTIKPGAIHALVGENGAGKSTIIKMLSGVLQPDEGRILVGGVPVNLRTPQIAQAHGIVTIHQERTLVDSLTALENIFLGREFLRSGVGLFGAVDERRMRFHVRSLCNDFGFPLPLLDREAGKLPGVAKQIVELIKALAFQANLVVMDEPTAAVTDHEREVLFGHMRRLRTRGAAVLWVTHHLDELPGMADTVTVLRDGVLAGEVDGPDIAPAQIVRMMVGRDVQTIESLIAEQGPSGAIAKEEAMRVKGLRSAGSLRGVDFVLHRSEILGIGGLSNAALTELIRVVIGADRRTRGEVTLEERPCVISSTADALKARIAYVPDERKLHGILRDFSVAQNISIASLDRVTQFHLVNRRKEFANAETYRSSLQIRAQGVAQPIALLSGGNQQKVVIARALATEPRIIIFHEPTQGVDIGAKMEIYRLIRDFVARGGSAIVVSTELVELLGLSDRVLVLREGVIAGEVPGCRTVAGAITTRALEEQFMHIAAGELEDVA